jgi:sugar O-acyltransferase (sialic acid O-acetyltransferase NeuD family)
MKKIILGKSSNYLSFCLDVLCDQSKDDTFDIVKNIPDDPMTLDVPYLIPNRMINEYSFEDYRSFDLGHRYVLGVYSPKSKKSVYQFFLDRYGIDTANYLNTIANNAILPHVYSIGHGCFINYNCVISAYTTIHNFVSINRNCSIGHHCILHDFVTISPGTNIAGHCEIGEHTFIGIGTTILNNITIGKNVVIGAGSVVTKNIPDNTVYYGSPAKYVKNNL